MTLPAISDLEYSGYDIHEGGFVLGSPAWNDWKGTYPLTTSGNVDTSILNTPVMNISLEVTGFTPVLGESVMYTSRQFQESRAAIQELTNYMVQLVAYDDNSRVVAASTVLNFCTPKNGYYIPVSTYKQLGDYTPEGGVNREKVITGEFRYTTNGVWKFTASDGNNWDISLGQNVSYSYLRLKVTKVGRARYNTGAGFQMSSVPNLNILYFGDGQHSWVTVTQQYTCLKINSSEAQFPNGEQISSQSIIKKEKLLKSDYTPAEYLIGYTKIFGLYYNVHIDNKTIDIQLRNNYYDGRLIDINEYIDRGMEIKIVPLTYDKKFYDLKYKEDDSSMFLEQYKDTYSKTFGQQRINTSYEFNNDSKNLLDSIPYQSAVEALEKSKYYRDLYTRRLSRPIWTISEWQFTLWDYEDEEYKSYSKDMPAVQPNTAATYWNSMEGYDIFPKLQFRDSDNSPVDCKNVLVFFNGFQSLTNAKGATIPFWLTDENAHMLTINDGKPCWLYTEREQDEYGTNIAIRINSLPQFGRYKMNNNQIDLSWDFGEPLELYSPTYVSNPESTIYSQYWKDYLTDLYSVNTRVVTCYVYCSRPLSKQDLRHFYFFDNSYWVINKIIDYNPNKQVTKIEFVKVNNTLAYTTNLSIDSNDYLNVIPTNLNFTTDLSTLASIQSNLCWGAYIVYEDESGETFSASITSTNFDLIGGSAILTINATSGLAWTITSSDWISASSTAGTGSSTVTLTIPQTSSTRTGSVVVSGSNGSSSSFTITQQTTSVEIVPSQTVYTINPNCSGIAYTVTVASNVPYTVSASTDWLSATTSTAGVVFKALSNNTGDTLRNGVISLIYGGTVKATITVYQMAEIASNWAFFSNGTTAITYTFSSAATLESYVEESMTSNVEYTVQANQNWLSASTIVGGIKFCVLEANQTGEERQGSVSIKYQGETLAVATIKQQEQPQVVAYIEPDTNLVEFGYSNMGWQYEDVQISSNVSWTASTTTGFVLDPQLPSAQTGDGYIRVKPNMTGTTDLVGSINIVGESGTTASVSLKRYRPAVLISDSSYVFDCHATSFTFTVSAMSEFSVVASDSWLTPSIASGESGISSVTVTVGKNTEYDKPDVYTELPHRMGYLYLSATYLTYVTEIACQVKQYQTNLSASTSVNTLSSYGGSFNLNIGYVDTSAGMTLPEWEIGVSDSWLVLPETTSGDAATSLTIGYSATTTSRTGSVYVYDKSDHDFVIELGLSQPYISADVEYSLSWCLGSPDLYYESDMLTVTIPSEICVNWESIGEAAQGQRYDICLKLSGFTDDYSYAEELRTSTYDFGGVLPTGVTSGTETLSIPGNTLSFILPDTQGYTKFGLTTSFEHHTPQSGAIVNYTYTSGNTSGLTVYEPEYGVAEWSSLGISASSFNSVTGGSYGNFYIDNTFSGVVVTIDWTYIPDVAKGQTFNYNFWMRVSSDGTSIKFSFELPTYTNTIPNVPSSQTITIGNVEYYKNFSLASDVRNRMGTYGKLEVYLTGVPSGVNYNIKLGNASTPYIHK